MTTAVTGLGQSGPPLSQIPLLTPDQAGGLAALFKILGNDTRLRVLHAIARGGEVRVIDLAAEVGMTQQSVSNQLQRLLDRGILKSRRAGTSVYYRIADPCVPALLQAGICLVEDPRCGIT